MGLDFGSFPGKSRYKHGTAFPGLHTEGINGIWKEPVQARYGLPGPTEGNGTARYGPSPLPKVDGTERYG